MAKFTLTIEGDTERDGDLLTAIGKEATGGLGLNRLSKDPAGWADDMAQAVVAEERSKAAEEEDRRWKLDISPAYVAPRPPPQSAPPIKPEETAPKRATRAKRSKEAK